MSDSEKLYLSYRQSLREFWWITGAWGVFVIWNVASGALFAYQIPDPGAEMATVMGVPRWVFFTVLFPWLFGNAFILWFATKLMKDSSLNGTSDPEETDE